MALARSAALSKLTHRNRRPSKPNNTTPKLPIVPRAAYVYTNDNEQFNDNDTAELIYTTQTTIRKASSSTPPITGASPAKPKASRCPGLGLSRVHTQWERTRITFLHMKCVWPVPLSATCEHTRFHVKCVLRAVEPCADFTSSEGRSPTRCALAVRSSPLALERASESLLHILFWRRQRREGDSTNRAKRILGPSTAMFVFKTFVFKSLGFRFANKNIHNI